MKQLETNKDISKLPISVHDKIRLKLQLITAKLYGFNMYEKLLNNPAFKL